MELLLLSNSSSFGKPYFSFAKDIVRNFLEDNNLSSVIFIPYAATDSYDEYVDSVQKNLDGIQVRGIHTFEDKEKAIREAGAILVGGGNTFALINQLQKLNLLEPIRNAVQSGALYIGWSAGSNVSCPTIKTTNDMPIIEPDSFEALNLVGFQINPHYTEKTIDGHNGESRKQRLKEFLNLNTDQKVVAIPEESYLYVKQGHVTFCGKSEGKILTSHGETVIKNNTDITTLL